MLAAALALLLLPGAMAEEAFEEVLGGEEAVMGYAVQLYRTYRPDVVVTHDKFGEYGHTAHVIVSRIMREGWEKAADAAYRPELGEAWQAKKLYLHMYRDEIAVRMPWYEPLDFFDGKNALDMAKEGYKKHVSQQGIGHVVYESGSYNSRMFSLWFSAVGADEKKNDFFENIP